MSQLCVYQGRRRGKLKSDTTYEEKRKGEMSGPMDSAYPSQKNPFSL